MGLVSVFRAVGEPEYQRIAAACFRAFPPPPATETHFYPVATEAYAREVAARWLTRDRRSEWVGYVLRFRLPGPFLERFPLRRGAAADPREYRVPVAEVAELNARIAGAIEVIACYRGEQAVEGIC